MPINKIKNFVASNLRSDSSDNSAIVALDIGTQNVKALMIKLDGSGEVQVVGVGTAEQQLNDMQAGAIADIPAVVENCDKALSEAEEQGGSRASKVVVGIAGELIKGITNSYVVTREDATLPLEADELDQIVKQVQAKAYDEAKHELELELGTHDIELKLVNSALVSINVDGYKVTNPSGFQGKEVEVQLYTAFAPLIHIGAIERVVRDLDLELLAVAAEPFAVARSVVGDDPNASLNAILIDVGGGTTDIAVLRDGGLEGTRMFGIGGRSFTRTIAREMSLEFDDAEALKLSLSEEDVDAEDKKQAEAALQKTIDVWIQGVHLALAEFEWLDYLPNTIMLCGGGASLQLLRDALSDDEWQKDLPFSKMPKVRYISVTDVKNVIDTTKKISGHTMITALGLARVASDTAGGPAKKQSIKQKIDKALEN